MWADVCPAVREEVLESLPTWRTPTIRDWNVALLHALRRVHRLSYGGRHDLPERWTMERVYGFCRAHDAFSLPDPRWEGALPEDVDT